MHELFPEEAGLFLTHLKQVCRDFEQHQQDYRESWDLGFFSFDEWLSLSRQTLERIEQFEFNMIKSSKVFSDNEKFKLMVQVLYY